jgi:ABC-2 type transport system ATP-binding protein
MNPALEISNLSFSYSNDWSFRKTPAIKNISLTVNSGEAFGFLGNNGGGKTTTIKCILDLLKPSSGTIKIFGLSSRSTQARASIGYLSELPYFYDYLTVYELMEMLAGLSGIIGSAAKERIRKVLELVKVSSRTKTPMRHLSKGLTQRIGLAQALIAEPRLLILDEPFSGLDPIGRKEFRDIFVDLKNKGTTIFMSSHVLSDVEFICDRVSIMSNGSIKGIFDINNENIFGSGDFELTLINPKGALLEDLPGQLDRASESNAGRTILRLRFLERKYAESAMSQALALGIAVDRFEYKKPNLEDIFIKLVKPEDSKKES